MWPFKSKRKLVRLPAAEIGTMIIEEILDPFPAEFVDGLREDWSGSTAFRERLRLFQYACVCIALNNRENVNSRFARTRKTVEASFSLVTNINSAEALDFLDMAKSDLERFLSRDLSKMQFSWARDWLSSADIEEENPAVLSQFAMHWPHLYMAVLSALDGFDPI